MYGRNSNIIQCVVVVIQLGDDSTSGSGKGGTSFFFHRKYDDIYMMIYIYIYILCLLDISIIYVTYQPKQFNVIMFNIITAEHCHRKKDETSVTKYR